VTSTTLSKVLPTYARLGVTFVDGEGSWLVDDTGKRYLDLFAGIAVVGLGHRHPAPTTAAHAQLDKLWHVSNLYWTEPMQELSQKLSDRFGGASSFFCNSGAEANEAALKWARKVTGKTEFVALDGSFHGRTFGALSITGQPAKRAAFEPLVPGAKFGLEHVGPATAAIVIEPVQGEGGVHPMTPEFLAEARALADEHGAMLIFDEVQTGVGRSGSFFASQELGVKPDAVTLAKGLANGLPIGAFLVSDTAPTGFEPGDHASTFGGNLVTSAAACAVLDTVDDELLAHVKEISKLFVDAFAARGLGLLLAFDTDGPANDVVEAALERGLVIGSAGANTIRLTPPLTLSHDEAEQGISLLKEVLV
jgi:acetylornithine/succinyldiaminopimelate/putrescine aminotransferase